MSMVGYIYNTDNMNNTFKKGDKVYVIPQDFAADGQMILIQTANEETALKFFYHAEDGYILTDDKNPPERVQTVPVILGVVVGYERMFDPEECDLRRLSPEAAELLTMAKDLPAERIKQVTDFLISLQKNEA